MTASEAIDRASDLARKQRRSYAVVDLDGVLAVMPKKRADPETILEIIKP